MVSNVVDYNSILQSLLKNFNRVQTITAPPPRLLGPWQLHIGQFFIVNDLLGASTPWRFLCHPASRVSCKHTHTKKYVRYDIIRVLFLAAGELMFYNEMFSYELTYSTCTFWC